MSNLTLNIFKDGAATTSLHQGFTTLLDQHLPLHTPSSGSCREQWGHPSASRLDKPKVLRLSS